jgi:hypothetical protein
MASKGSVRRRAAQLPLTPNREGWRGAKPGDAFRGARPAGESPVLLLTESPPQGRNVLFRLCVAGTRQAVACRCRRFPARRNRVPVGNQELARSNRGDAASMNEPVLCDKIPWSVESPGGFFTEPSYERSECYDFIAGRTRNPWLCRKVKRLGAFSVLSKQTSMWTCLDHAVHGRNSGIASAPALPRSCEAGRAAPESRLLERSRRARTGRRRCQREQGAPRRKSAQCIHRK